MIEYFSDVQGRRDQDPFCMIKSLYKSSMGLDVQNESRRTPLLLNIFTRTYTQRPNGTIWKIPEPIAFLGKFVADVYIYMLYTEPPANLRYHSPRMAKCSNASAQFNFESYTHTHTHIHVHCQWSIHPKLMENLALLVWHFTNVYPYYISA